MNTTEFTHEGVEYQITEFPNLHRVQLKQRLPNAKWEVAAETLVPEGEDLGQAALRMRQLVTGEIGIRSEIGASEGTATP